MGNYMFARLVYGFPVMTDNNDEEFVDNYIKDREKDGKWIPHPSAPNNKKINLYFVFDATEIKGGTKHSKIDKPEHSAEVDRSTAAEILPGGMFVEGPLDVSSAFDGASSLAALAMTDQKALTDADEGPSVIQHLVHDSHRNNRFLPLAVGQRGPDDSR